MVGEIEHSQEGEPMIDIHSHLIFGVDDGPTRIDESLNMAAEAKKVGIDTIIATPHFQKFIYETDKIMDNFLELKYRISNLGMNLLLGYEVFINPLFTDRVEAEAGLTLGGSRYILFELPYNIPPEAGYEILLKLQKKGIIPIIAHPERNRNFLKNYDSFLRMIALGCLVQVDAASILGVYGNNSKRFVRHLLEADLVDFVASDAHCPEDYKNWYLQAYLEFSRLAGTERTEKFFSLNAENILGGSRMSVPERV